MPVNKLTIQDFAAKVKAKYPEYKDVNDTLLTQKIIAKYPEYKDRVNMEASGGKTDTPEPATNVPQQQTGIPMADISKLQQVKLPQTAPNEWDYKQQEFVTKNKAIDNTLQRKYKNLGIKVDKNSPKYKSDYDEVLNSLHSGDIVQTQTKSGEPITTRGAGFWESLGSTLVDSFKQPIQAAKMTNLTGAKLADYLDELSREQPEVPESAPSGFGGQVGGLVGGFPKTAGLFAINEAVPYLGTALATAETELSSTGQHTQSLYQQNLKALTDSGMPLEKARIEAANKAKTDAPLTAAPDAIAMAALGSMGADAKGLNDAANTFKSTLLKSGKSVGKFGLIGGVAGASEKGIEKAQGYDVNMQDIIDNFGKEGFQYATLDAMFKIAPLISKMPSSVQSAWKNYITKVPKPIVEEMTSKMGEQGEEIKKDLKGYEEADKVVPQHYSDEKRVALSNLVQQKNALEKDNETAHSSFKDENKKQIEQVDSAIKTVATSKNNSVGRMDVLTGESEGNPKEYEDLSNTEKKGIVVPDDYGEVEVKETGEGENKKYTAKAKYLDKDGAIEYYKPIKVEGDFTDKTKAKEAAEQALKQHFYENTLGDHLKPQKSETKEKAEITNQESNEGSGEGNESISSEIGGIAEGTVNKVGEGTPEEINNNLQENILPLQSNESASQNISKEENQSTENSTGLPIEKSAKEPNYSERLKKIEEVIDPHDRVLEYFANNGKIHSSAIQELFGNKRGKSVQGEQMARVGLQHKNAPSIDKLAHQLWESDTTGKHTTQDYKEAIETVLNNYNSKAAMTKDLVDRYDIETAYEKYLQQAHGQEAIDMVESMNEDEMNHVLQMESEGASHEELEKYIDNLQSQNPETRKQITDIEEKRNNELHEASKPVIEFERIKNKDFADIEDADKIKSSKEKHTDIFRRKKILDKLIDCL